MRIMYNLISLLHLILTFQYSKQQIQIITSESPYSIIEISNSRLTSDNLLSSSNQESLQRCATKCNLVTNCYLICRNATSSCNLYRIYATKTFVETYTGPKSKCYTSLSDLVTGKTVEASPVPWWYSAQDKIDSGKENFVNGIYDYVFCYVSDHYAKPYFVIDLGAIYSFKMMTFRCQQGSYAQRYCRGLYIKISDTSAITQGDFSSFADYGYFAGPGTSDQTITIWKDASARYISMQMDLGFAEHMTICYLRVI